MGDYSRVRRDAFIHSEQQGESAQQWDIDRAMERQERGGSPDERYPLVRGWSQAFNLNPVLAAPTLVTNPDGSPIYPQGGVYLATGPGQQLPAAGTPWTLLQFQAHYQGCLAITTDGANFILAVVTIVRQQAPMQRGSPGRNLGGTFAARNQIIVPPWGIAMPVGAGFVQADITLVAPVAAPPPATDPQPLPLSPLPAANALQTVFGAYSIGVPVPERYQTPDLFVPAPALIVKNAIVVNPPDFARTMTVTVVNGAPAPGGVLIDGTLPVPTGGSVTLGAAQRTIEGTVVGTTSVVSVLWEILGP